MPRSRKVKRSKTRKSKRSKTRRRAGVNSPKKKSPSPRTIKVTILVSDGTELTFHVAHQTTIGDLKSKIEKQNGYDKDRQLLFDIEDD